MGTLSAPLSDADIDREHGTPWKAPLTISICSVVGTVLGSWLGRITYTAECTSIGSLALIIGSSGVILSRTIRPDA